MPRWWQRHGVTIIFRQNIHLFGGQVIRKLGQWRKLRGLAVHARTKQNKTKHRLEKGGNVVHYVGGREIFILIQ